MTWREARGHTIAALACLLVLSGCGRGAGVPDGLVDDETPPELARLVSELMPRIERLSGLERREPLRVRRQDRAAASLYVQQRLDGEMPPERLEGIRRTYVTLGLLPDTLDLRSLLLDLYTEQVLGYYDPRSGTLFVVHGEDAETLRPVVAHELVHALQDQHTDIDSLVAADRGNDRQAAAHAALEGHAMVVMFAVLAEQASRREIDPAQLPNPADELGPALASQNEQFPVFRRAPAVIRETLLFPYVRGADFVHQLWRSMDGSGGYPAPLDTLLPQSTAQVMRPIERFVEQRLDPLVVVLDAPPGGYELLHENTLGQLETSIFLGEHLGEDARAAAHGWAGDRFMLVRPADGGDVLHWISAWETAGEADRFAAAAARAAERRQGRRVAVAREDGGGVFVVRIVDAPAGAASVAWQPAYRIGEGGQR